MRSFRSSVLALALSAIPAAVVFFAPETAHAGIEACNNIEVKATARCKVETKGGCTAQCTPVKFEAACAAKLEAQCAGECSVEANVDCKASCTGACEAKYQANPGSLDCSANCQASCEGNCSASCAAEPNKAECQASCKATCGGSCDAKCSGTPPSASAEAKCEASCSGSCEAKASMDCQVQCQAEGYAECKADLQGGCKAQCEEPSGALFCDGQYVDTGNNLEECVAALNAYLDVKVDAHASASCSNGECTAEGVALASCASTPSAPSPAGSLIVLGGLGAVIAAAAVRRRRSAEGSAEGGRRGS
jgi:hypothetical protein